MADNKHINFKLDLSSLLKLSLLGENYYNWKIAWKRAFCFIGVLDIVTDAKVCFAIGNDK